MKGLDRLSPGCRVQDKTSSVASVLDLHTEFVVKIAAVPEQVDHDPGGLPKRSVPQIISSTSSSCACRSHAPPCAKRRAVSLQPAALQGWGQQVYPKATGRQ